MMSLIVDGCQGTRQCNVQCQGFHHFSVCLAAANCSKYSCKQDPGDAAADAVSMECLLLFDR